MTHRQSEVRIAAVKTVDFERNVGLTIHADYLLSFKGCRRYCVRGIAQLPHAGGILFIACLANKKTGVG